METLKLQKKFMIHLNEDKNNLSFRKKVIGYQNLIKKFKAEHILLITDNIDLYLIVSSACYLSSVRLTMFFQTKGYEKVTYNALLTGGRYMGKKIIIVDNYPFVTEKLPFKDIELICEAYNISLIYNVSLRQEEYINKYCRKYLYLLNGIKYPNTNKQKYVDLISISDLATNSFTEYLQIFKRKTTQNFIILDTNDIINAYKTLSSIKNINKNIKRTSFKPLLNIIIRNIINDRDILDLFTSFISVYLLKGSVVKTRPRFTITHAKQFSLDVSKNVSGVYNNRNIKSRGFLNNLFYKITRGGYLKQTILGKMLNKFKLNLLYLIYAINKNSIFLIGNRRDILYFKKIKFNMFTYKNLITYNKLQEEILKQKTLKILYDSFPMIDFVNVKVVNNFIIINIKVGLTFKYLVRTLINTNTLSFVSLIKNIKNVLFKNAKKDQDFSNMRFLVTYLTK